METVSEKKLLDIINSTIANEFAIIQKQCTVSALSKKKASPNWEIRQFRTSPSLLRQDKYSYAVFKILMKKLTQKYEVKWEK